ncbi:MAG: chemotaxis protein CheA [Bacteroidota bacterium]|nr:chemotaxis protein CheA [Bacteroidota bacterium]
MDEEYIQIFIDEASDLISSLEDALLTLEKDKTNPEMIGQVFRVMHSLKGAAGMFGFESIGDFTHGLEDIYDLVRNGKISINDELMEITLKSVDHLRDLLKDPEIKDKNIGKIHAGLIEKINNLKDIISGTIDSEAAKDINKEVSGKSDNSDAIDKAEVVSYYIYFKPSRDILKEGVNPLLIISNLCDLGLSKVYKKIKWVDNLKSFDVSDSFIEWYIFLVTNKKEVEIKDIFLYISSDNEVEISGISDTNIFLNENKVRKLETLFENKGDKEIIAEEFTEILKDYENEEESEESEVVNEKNETTVKKEIKSTIKVSSEKLDELMNLVSELVTAQAELGVLSNLHNIQKLTTVAENIEKISRSLRDNALNICLVPMEEMMFQFKRLVRDLSNELDKEIVFETEGTDTELDKRLIENLKEPFMHIFRNAIDHGIENREERISKGKKPTGTIKLKSYYSGADVHIQIIDDGKGMDPEKIREKGIQKKLIKKEDELSKKEILELIFQPGFSTAEVITDVSGRGVGMDVVRRKINEVNGVVEVESEINEGTTITIKLPLSLSIIDALLVKIDETPFLIPLSFVDKCDEATSDQIINSVNNRIMIDGELIPLIYLRREFEIDKNCPDMHRLIIIKYNDIRIALVVDSIVGEHQAVLKPLGDVECNEEIITSACILGDGSVALVMDTNKLVEYYRKKKEELVNCKCERINK